MYQSCTRRAGRVKFDTIVQKMELVEAGALIEGGLAEVAGIVTTASGLATGLTTALGYGPTQFYKGMSQVTPRKRLKSDTHTDMPARTLGPAAIGNRSRYRTQLGRRPGKFGTRKFTVEGSKSNLVDKTQEWNRCIAVPWSENEAEINARRGALCHVKGVKLRYWFQFPSNFIVQSAAYQFPLQVRWAVLNPKTNDGNSINGNQPDFFIDTNPVEDIAEPFPTTGTHFRYMNRKINREAYGVLKEGMFLLHNHGDVQNNTTAPKNPDGKHQFASSMKYVNLYIPINRQMEWDNIEVGAGNEYPEANVYFVYWYTRAGDPNIAQHYGASYVPLNQHHEHITYFTNSQMYR